MSRKTWPSHPKAKRSYQTLMRKENEKQDLYIEIERDGSNRPPLKVKTYRVFYNGKWIRPGYWNR